MQGESRYIYFDGTRTIPGTLASGIYYGNASTGIPVNQREHERPGTPAQNFLLTVLMLATPALRRITLPGTLIPVTLEIPDLRFKKHNHVGMTLKLKIQMKI